MIANGPNTAVSAQINVGRRTLWTSQMLTSSSSHNLIYSFPAIDNLYPPQTIGCLRLSQHYWHSLQDCNCHLISASPTFGETREEQVRRISELQWTSAWDRRVRPKNSLNRGCFGFDARQRLGVRNSSWRNLINPGKDWIYLHICRLWRE
jgi:hypothetical protein